MTKTTSKGALTGSEIVELAEVTTLEQLCVCCGVEEAWIGDLVAHGVIAPAAPTGKARHFAAGTVVRIRKAKRLQRDFELNTSGVALALDLLDEIDRLRARLAAFERARE